MIELLKLSETLYNNIEQLLSFTLIENIKLIDIIITLIIIKFIRKLLVV